MIASTLAERFWAKVQKTNTCWLWLGSTRAGYGRMWFKAKGKKFSRSAPRLAWELTAGPIPQQIVVLHRCDNKLCVRPSHLFIGTQRDNKKLTQQTVDRIRRGILEA